MIPVVIAANGLGTPVINNPGGVPAIVAANGRGMPIVIVTVLGVPMNVSGAP